MAWRIAESLKTLRAQINAAYPNRDKRSDGGIGDAAHASRNSDHNPWVKDKYGVGVVTAIDIDEDLAADIHSIENVVKAIQKSRDPRVKYIIYEKRITVQGSELQKWKPYTGINPHDHHAHISVFPDPKLYDSTKLWDLGLSPLKGVTDKEIDEALSPAGAATEVPTVINSNTEAGERKEAPDNTASAQSQPPIDVSVQKKTVETKETPEGTLQTTTTAQATETQVVNAPPPDGTTSTSVRTTVLGVTLPPAIAIAVKAVSDLIEKGFISAGQIGDFVMNLVTQNLPYVFILIGLIIVGLMLRKAYKQISFFLQMHYAASKDKNNVEVNPQ